MAKPHFPVAALIIRILIIGFGVAVFFEQAGARQLLHLDGPGAPGMLSSAYWVSLVAPVFFLTALWQATNALVRMDRDDAFGAPMVRCLREMGGCLMLGAFAAIVVEPSLTFLIANGFSEMRGARFDLNIENITIGLVGLVLLLLAREGQNLKSKLDEFV
jgi:hypothetical protein